MNGEQFLSVVRQEANGRKVRILMGTRKPVHGTSFPRWRRCLAAKAFRSSGFRGKPPKWSSAEPRPHPVGRLTLLPTISSAGRKPKCAMRAAAARRQSQTASAADRTASRCRFSTDAGHREGRGTAGGTAKTVIRRHRRATAVLARLRRWLAGRNMANMI